ncbi:hypothetical protein MET9862_00771 [Methylobacterium symbioticum]|uniref:Uncharacterized protein n=1 Tax=Methylobacterium symbioticum TaxID=2584084 RepID=A0A509E7U8_9HYPH|nr:hypothetical protein MET9862_00771 [Methylobacterium symbioticum]
MNRIAIAIAGISTLVLLGSSSEARPLGGGHGYAGHHAVGHGLRAGRRDFYGYGSAGFGHRYRGHRGVGFRQGHHGYGSHHGRYGYAFGHRGLGFGLAASAFRPAYRGPTDGYGYPYAPVGYGSGVGRPYCGCGY